MTGCAGKAVDMWTMRWRAPARSVDNAGALPTARAFDHMPTACNYDEIKRMFKQRPRRGVDQVGAKDKALLLAVGPKRFMRWGPSGPGTRAGTGVSR